MKDFYNPSFELEALSELQGYSLQVFASGRVKLSFHNSHIQRYEYYAEWPKRDTEAFARQRKRSEEWCAHHFDLVDTLRSQWECRAILRVHLKGDNNKTADNAHVLMSCSQNLCVVVLSGLVHFWEIPTDVIQGFWGRQGAQKGVPSIFNEYMPSFEHDWSESHFCEDDYKKGYRNPARHAVPSGDSDFNF